MKSTRFQSESVPVFVFDDLLADRARDRVDEMISLEIKSKELIRICTRTPNKMEFYKFTRSSDLLAISCSQIDARCFRGDRFDGGTLISGVSGYLRNEIRATPAERCRLSSVEREISPREFE